MKILCAVDKSHVSDAVVEMTSRLACEHASSVLLVSVAPREPDVLGRQVKRKVVSDPIPELLLERRAILDRHAATFAAAGIACETLLVRGDPGSALLHEAKLCHADLIIMGSHGRGALYRKLMGSVSEAVLRARKYPVLVVPAQAPSKSKTQAE